MQPVFEPLKFQRRVLGWHHYMARPSQPWTNRL